MNLQKPGFGLVELCPRAGKRYLRLLGNLGIDEDDRNLTRL